MRGIMKIRTILLPTDFSECGNYALSYAASLARTFKASIICINVIEPIVPTVGYTGMAEPLPIADIAEQLEDSAERELPKLAECDECAGLEIEELVVHGEAFGAVDHTVDLGGLQVGHSLDRVGHERLELGPVVGQEGEGEVVRHPLRPPGLRVGLEPGHDEEIGRAAWRERG